jgi:hypothetical protein
MAQYHELNNYYKINSMEAFQELLQRLQAVSGKRLEGDKTTYNFNVGTDDDPRSLYKLTFIKTEEGEGVYAWLAARELINDPMHNLRSAEELIGSMLTLREFNSRPGRVFMGEQQVALTATLKKPQESVNGAVAQEHGDAMEEVGLTNFFQQWDPLTWLETVAKFKQEHQVDLDAGVPIHFRTGPADIDTGIFVLTKVITEDDKAGLEVTLDGQPFYNYPRPELRTAEQIVSYVLLLRKNYGAGKIGNEFNFSPDNAKPLVATLKEGQNEIRLFSNGTITITGPGVMKIVTMADADASKANELMEQILDLTLKN